MLGVGDHRDRVYVTAAIVRPRTLIERLQRAAHPSQMGSSIATMGVLLRKAEKSPTGRHSRSSALRWPRGLPSAGRSNRSTARVSSSARATTKSAPARARGSRQGSGKGLALVGTSASLCTHPAPPHSGLGTPNYTYQGYTCRGLHTKAILTTAAHTDGEHGGRAEARPRLGVGDHAR